LYAVLTALGLMDNPMAPTTPDYAVAQAVLKRMKTHVKDGNCKKFVSAEDEKKFMLMPSPPVTTLDLNNYGGAKVTYRILAHYLNVDIIVVNPKFKAGLPRACGAMTADRIDTSAQLGWSVVLSSSPMLRDKGINLRTVRTRWLQVVEDGDTPPIMVEHNDGQGGGGHFAAWVAGRVTMKGEGLANFKRLHIKSQKLLALTRNRPRP
jgi:hypothetical protein